MSAATRQARQGESLQRRAVALCALLALAWIQVSAASHQFEHLPGEPDRLCGTCILLNESDEFVHVHPSHLGVAATWPVPEFPGVSSQHSELFRSFDSRAPPQD